MKRTASLLCLIIAATFLGGCSSATDRHSYTFHASEYAFAGPDVIQGGLVTLRLENDGDRPHHMALARLDAGKSLADLLDALLKNQEPGWAHWVAGPGPFEAGSGGAVTTTLEAGHYVALCFLPDADGASHFAKGMMRDLTVTEPAGTPEPTTPDLTLTLTDFRFAFDKVPTAGRVSVQIDNSGTQPHEAVLVKLDEGATPDSFIAGLGPNATGPPPGKFWGGITHEDPGARATVEWNLPPGNYLLLCFVTDPATGRSHFDLGMKLEFTV